jgi:hypothetical protein
MEGIQTIQALKAVQSSLPAQTTIPSDELVMLYAADGTPIAKIARDDLVKAVASVMASNSQTTFSKLLGVQANGTPMGIGASDLASVLGVPAGMFNSRYLDPGKVIKLTFGSRYASIFIGRGNSSQCVLHAMVSGYGVNSERNTANKISTSSAVKIYTDNTETCVLYITNSENTGFYLYTLNLAAIPTMTILNSLPSTAVELA